MKLAIVFVTAAIFWSGHVKGNESDDVIAEDPIDVIEISDSLSDQLHEEIGTLPASPEEGGVPFEALSPTLQQMITEELGEISAGCNMYVYECGTCGNRNREVVWDGDPSCAKTTCWGC